MAGNVEDVSGLKGKTGAAQPQQGSHLLPKVEHRAKRFVEKYSR